MLKIGDELMETMTSYLYKPYQNVKSSRQLNTVYTNNKNYPIQVLVTIDFKASTTWREIDIIVDNNTVGTEYLSGNSLTNYRDIRSICFTVLPGQTYELWRPASSGEVDVYYWFET